MNNLGTSSSNITDINVVPLYVTYKCLVSKVLNLTFTLEPQGEKMKYLGIFFCLAFISSCELTPEQQANWEKL